MTIKRVDFLPHTLLSADELEQVQDNAAIQVDTVAELADLPTTVKMAYVTSIETLFIYKDSDWVPVIPSPGRNLLHNSAFNVWQRGTSFTSINADNTYTADRWYVARGGLLDVSKGTTGPPVGFVNYMAMINKTTSNAFIVMYQAVETVNVLPYVGKTVTLSFWARAAANTTASKNMTVQMLYSTSVDTKPGSLIGSATTLPALTYGTTASDWVQYSVSATIPSDAKTIGVGIVSAPVGGLAINDGFHITGVQLEQGSAATPFEHKDYGQELAECQRYFQRFGYVANERVATGVAITSTYSYLVFSHRTMRTTPSAYTLIGTMQVTIPEVVGANVTSVTGSVLGPDASELLLGYSTNAAFVLGRAVLCNPADTSSYVGISADL